MNDSNRRTDWMVVFAVALIAAGAWFLLGNVMGTIFGDMWWRALSRLRGIVWPVALIALGVLVYVASQRGWSPGDARGRRMYRSRSDRMVAGVLGGLGVYLGIDSTWMRLGYVLFALVTGFWPAVLVYVVAVAIVPEEPVGYQAPSRPHSGAPTPGPHVGPQVWRETGTETVQTPPPPPAGWSPHAEEPPAPPAPSPSATDEPKQS